MFRFKTSSTIHCIRNKFIGVLRASWDVRVKCYLTFEYITFILQLFLSSLIHEQEHALVKWIPDVSYPNLFVTRRFVPGVS